MSAWVEGKLELNCSINILRKAIVNIMPEWEDFILVDEKGQIPMYRYNGDREYGNSGFKTAHLIIPGSGHPKIDTAPKRGAHNDWGFRRTSDGKWETTFADFGLGSAQKLETQIKGEVAMMKAQAIAQMRGYEILSVEETDEEKYMDIKVDSETYEQLK
jgi:hypothetical protein